MQTQWRQTLQYRFFFTRELLLGVRLRSGSNQKEYVVFSREWLSNSEALLLGKERVIHVKKHSIRGKRQVLSTGVLSAQPSLVASHSAVLPSPQTKSVPIVAAQPEAPSGKRSARAKRKKASTRSSRLMTVLSGLLITIGLAIAVVYVVPDFYFRIFPADVIRLNGNTAGPEQTGDSTVVATPSPTPTPYTPPIDPSLPDGDWLLIPEIGIKTQPQRTTDPETALASGVWMSPDYGTPGDVTKPIILAAHRFGWKWWWSSDYWKYNSFYNLPETGPGTRVELISDKRKWVYEIYGGEEGDQITDYGADMILYTCKFLNSPIRHVRYARLIHPDTGEAVRDAAAHVDDSAQTDLTQLLLGP